MAQGKQRYISTSFWDDPWVQTLDPSEKFLYLYLLTNPLTNIAGVYELTMRRMVFDTGFNEDTIKGIFEKFRVKEKAYYYEGWVIIPRWVRHQKVNNPNVRAGINRILSDLPEGVLDYCYHHDVEALKGFERQSHSYSYSDSDSDPDSDPDSEEDSSRKQVLFEIPEGTDSSRCRSCRAPIFWIVTKNGKKMPVDPDGTSHFATCPDANEFRRSS